MQGNKMIPIIVSDIAMPKKDTEHPCPCQDIPVKLQYKQGILLAWYKNPGDNVEMNEVICEGEVEKKTIEFTAPCQGVLALKCLDSEDVFKAGSVLGYIEPSE